MGTKPPGAVGERISKDERHDSCDVAPSSTKTSSLQGRSGGLASTPKVIEVFSVHLEPFVQQYSYPHASLVPGTALAAPFVRS